MWGWAIPDNSQDVKENVVALELSSTSESTKFFVKNKGYFTYAKLRYVSAPILPIHRSITLLLLYGVVLTG